MFIVTDQDVRYRFVGDGSEEWVTPALVSVVYSTDPVGAHKRTGKVGSQAWEGLVQKDDASLGKAVMLIDVPALPDGAKRIMEFQFRVRSEDDESVATGWSETNTIRIVGKPGKPNMVR